MSYLLVWRIVEGGREGVVGEGCVMGNGISCPRGSKILAAFDFRGSRANRVLAVRAASRRRASRLGCKSAIALRVGGTRMSR